MQIARELIDADADKILRRLRRNGYEAYLVGGCVRDLLLGRTPKDFDIATSATPQEIKDLFRNCRIIGRRFRLAHIFFGQKIIETSTFRTNPREGVDLEAGDEILIRRDNVFGTAEEDARRRDFTINGLFYDIEAGEVKDYVGGLADLEARLVRTIGDPDIRFREDPVRILRAIKFAARLGFAFEPETYRALLAHRAEISKCAAPRVLEEVYRLLRGGAARRSMELLIETGVLAVLAPELAWLFGYAEAAPPSGPLPDDAALAARRKAAWAILAEIDDKVRAQKPPTNALLLGALVAPFVPADGEAVEPDGAPGPGPGNDHAAQAEGLLGPVVLRLRASRRDAERARQILLALRRLAPGRRRRLRPMALVKRDYFAETLELYELLLRARGHSIDELDRWRTLAQRSHALPGLPGAPGPDGEESGERARRRRRRRRGGRRRRGASAAVVGALAGAADPPPDATGE
ncbi:MAG TPA: polynucleotide adenylyltransferase PcnB [Haliangiales bacterium]|nr:polynucleotide adenylyltransferase PcnB [Haliangiales bacterium]